jgi:hypothetical protein
MHARGILSTRPEIRTEKFEYAPVPFAALDEEAPDVLPRSQISSLTTLIFVGGVCCVLRRYLFV